MVDVVVGDVEAHRRSGLSEWQERQLRRAHLHREDVELVVHDGVDERDADVAGRGGAAARGAQDRLEHERGRRLAVGARDAQPRRRGPGRAGATRARARPTPGRRGRSASDDDAGRRPQARRHDEDVGVLGQPVAVSREAPARR